MSVWRHKDDDGEDDTRVFELRHGSSGEQPLGRLAPQAWMTQSPTRRVVAALTTEGAEVRFIGGCVRDAILQRQVRDIDLALALPPDAVMRLLTAAGIKVIPTGVDHGTVTALIEGVPFEITTLRIDVETDGRRAKVAFTDDWVADAARRDFTINAMSCTPDGSVYDYFDGLRDLGQGRIRFVGDARARISEDVLRLLRFFRFYAHYGKPPPDGDALAACREWADKVTLLSGERVRIEILRTLLAPNPNDAFEFMRTHHVLEHVLPEASEPGRLRQMAWLELSGLPPGTVSVDAIRRLAALVRTSAEGATQLGERLRLSNRERERLVALAAPVFCPEPDAPPLELQHALHRLGRETVIDLILLAWAAERARVGVSRPVRTQAWQAMLDRARAWVANPFPLRGRDAVAAGIAHGPDIGRLMAEVEAWWAEDGYTADREACLARMRALIAHRLGDRASSAQA